MTEAELLYRMPHFFSHFLIITTWLRNLIWKSGSFGRLVFIEQDFQLKSLCHRVHLHIKNAIAFWKKGTQKHVFHVQKLCFWQFLFLSLNVRIYIGHCNVYSLKISKKKFVFLKAITQKYAFKELHPIFVIF